MNGAVRLRYVPALDGVRALAVAVVLLFTSPRGSAVPSRSWTSART